MSDLKPTARQNTVEMDVPVTNVGHNRFSEQNMLTPLVLVNLDANAGSAGKRWDRLSPALKNMLPGDTRYFSFQPPCNLEPVIRSHLEAGNRCFISAGGDGTISHVLNVLATIPDMNLNELYLGGIGLGSSNDFTKPVRDEIQSIPLRISLDRSVLADIGRVVFVATDESERTLYFIVNASVGVTANANYLFNRGGGLTRTLKTLLVDLGIRYVALKTILTHKNIPATLRTTSCKTAESHVRTVRISNLAVLKNPHVSGNLRYDHDITEDNGCLGVELCVNMNRLELISVFKDLSHGTFSGKPKRISEDVAQIQIQTDAPVALETDGEVVKAANIRFDLSPSKINLLG